MLARFFRVTRRAVALPSATWVALVRVLPVVLMTRVLLWLLPYKTVARLFEPQEGRPVKPYSRLIQTVRVAGWVGKTFLGDKPCLTQALAARWLLSRDGYQADLRIGARREEGAFMAHAWLERGGVVILGGADSPTKYALLRPIGLPAS